MSDDDLMLSADWSELPVDLLGLITDNLVITDKLKKKKKKNTTTFCAEYIRFGAVCFEWRSFFIQNFKQIKLPSKLPLLLLPSQFDDEDDDYNHENDEEEKNQDDNHEEEEEKNQDDEEEDDNEHDYYHDHDHDFHHHHPHELEPQWIHHDQRQHYYKRKGIWKGQDAETRHKTTRSFYSLSERKVNQDFRLPVPYYKNCRGSSHGWLVTVDEEQEKVQQPDGTTTYTDTYPVRLLNPFRSVNNEIQLPPLTPIPELDEEPYASYYLLKAYLSANPSSLSNPAADLLVFGVYGSNRFGFCRPGDRAWTHLPLGDQFRPIEDLICYKGRFLAVIQEGSVLELEFAHHLPTPSAKFVALNPPNGNIFNKKYLVESGGDLLQLQRHNVSGDYSTTGFRAFKLNEEADNDDDKWVEMDNLDGHMLFLGDNSSISISADDFPGAMPNCIYFTDDNYEAYEIYDWDGPHDIGIFNFEDRSIVFDDHGSMMPPPIWIQPML